MRKLALITALITASAVAVPAMADNGRRDDMNRMGMRHDASNHKYDKYNNGNGYGQHKNKHNVKARKYASSHYNTRHTNLHKWPVPTTPNNNPNHRHVMMGQHH